MYKVLIETKDILNPTKSPIHNIVNLYPQKQNQYQSIVENTKPLVRNLKGKVHLLRNLSTNIKQLSSKLKSRALLIVEFDSQIQNFLKERSAQLENLDYVTDEMFIDNKITGRNSYAIVVFKTVTTSQELKILCNDNFLNLYIENVTILCLQGSIEKELWKKILRDEQKEKQIWVEIPSCPKCLYILETQVTGMNLRLTKNDKQMLNSTPCKVCWVRSKQQSKCAQCSEIEDNWVCMVCGVIGCGRYKNADAFKHYINSGHILSLDLKTNHIWNYKFDCFSHRVAEREDTMMDLNERQNTFQFDDEEIEVQFWKYCNVVSEQLDKQRNFYNRIKQEEIQRYSAEEKALQQKIQEMTKLRDEKKQSLKKKVKKNKKIGKRYSQLEERCQQERLLTKNFQQSAKSKGEGKYHEVLQIKKLELKKLEEEIEKVYLKLSES